MDDTRSEPFFEFDEFDDEDVLDPDEEIVVLSVVPVRDTVVFPNMVSPLFVGRERSIRAVESAMDAGEPVMVVAQLDPELSDPKPEDLYTVGTEVTVGRLLRMPDGTNSILGQGQARLKVLEWISGGNHLRARAQVIPEEFIPTQADEALMRAVLALFEKCVQLSHNLPEDAYIAAMNADDPGWMADLIISMMEFDISAQQAILEIFDPTERLQRVSVMLAQELELLELEDRIQSQVQDEVDRSQREYFLREQMRIIQSELGEEDPLLGELHELRERVELRGMPDEVRTKALRELRRLEAMSPAAPEIGIIRTYLDCILDLPWALASEDNMDLAHAEKVLESNHYGLPKIKDRILEHIAVRKLAQDKMRSPILCFVGPPGTGKTSLGRSIAEALGRKFVRVSLGGMRDEAEIRGHRRTYIGAMPGRIIQGVRNAGTINPIFMLDEIDKVGADFRGDPSAALLEALDPEQNFEFSDHYLDLPYDLSQVMFITTANVLYTIPPALLDRMEIIEFSGYTEEEKLEIARNFLIPRQLEKHGLEDTNLSFSEPALQRLIREYTSEAGVRNLEREIANICRKAARTVAEGEPAPKLVSTASVEKLLGPPQYSFGVAEEEDEVGVAMGVSVTEAGGDLLPIEVIVMEGRGNLLLTGQLGEVIQESAQAALSYARANAKSLGIPIRDFDRIDIHIHLPEGAIPKDGPSAGITMATALISALSRRPVRRDVAMTGEITLRGRVLPIGGFKEKTLAAHRAGIKTFLAPKKNRKDLVDIPKKVQREIEICFVDRMDEVLPFALLDTVKGESSARYKGVRGRGSSFPVTRRHRRPIRSPHGRDDHPQPSA
ncbi:MAG: endopeptidase La [Chloroflexota bacterium]|nr:endopeptidase La [Chloroflexota bacterium]